MFYTWSPEYFNSLVYIIVLVETGHMVTSTRLHYITWMSGNMTNLAHQVLGFDSPTLTWMKSKYMRIQFYPNIFCKY